MNAAWKQRRQKVVALDPVIKGIDHSVEGLAASRPCKKRWVLSHDGNVPITEATSSRLRCVGRGALGCLSEMAPIRNRDEGLPDSLVADADGVGKFPLLEAPADRETNGTQ